MQKRGVYTILIGLILGAVLGYSAFYYNEKIKPQHSYDSDGWNYFNQENYDAAIYEFSTYLERDENNHFALEGMGWSLLREKRIDEALTYFEKAKALTENALLYEGLGWVYYAKEEHNKAMEHFKTSLLLNPQSEKAQEGLSWALFRGALAANDSTGFLEAEHSFTKLASHSPSSFSITYGLGWSQFYMGDYNSSLITFSRAQAINPSFRGTYRGMYSSHFRMGEYQQAVDAYVPLLENDLLFKSCIEMSGKGLSNESIETCIDQ